MPDRLPDALQDKLSKRLSYYEDIGIRLFYRDRLVARGAEGFEQAAVTIPIPQEEPLPKIAPKPIVPQTPSVSVTSSQKVTILPPAPKVSLFDAVSRIADDSLLKIREDYGECTRCKLHSTRNKIVFGDGNPKADLVFVGEGPGRDEDAQGLPFVGRAGKLLTQMIEAMGLQRSDVYICNVVKCRPPENRTPLPDEMEICGEFLFRQLSAIRPKAICALGSTAAKAVLGTKDGVTKLRGKWHKWRDIPVMVTFHPSYLLRPYNQNAKKEAWEDLKAVLHYVYD
jgi:DNA polymerase